MSKKFVFIVCVGFLCLICIALIPKDAKPILDATVNEQNGDVAIAYYESTSFGSILCVVVFDREGHELYSDSFWVSTGAEMAFKDNILCVTVGHKDELYGYDREGNVVGSLMSPKAIREAEAGFERWSGFFTQTYTLGEYTYCYKQPTIFRRKAQLTITHGDESVTVYESPAA